LTDATDTNDKELRNFGLLTGALFAALFGLGLPYIKGYSFPVWPWALASALWLPALLQPRFLKYPFFVWRRLGLALGWINSKVILSLIFFLVISPIGIVARLLGHDPISRNYEPEATSYRVPSTKISAEGMDSPF
jgi:hypothetical protein